MRAYNSTIHRKKKVCRSCGKEEYIFSKNRCQRCATKEDTISRDLKYADKEIEDGLQDLITDADTIFSQYIRLKYSNEFGILQCFTCDWIDKWTQLQNGHYIKRGHLYLRWDERNCRPQCGTCNTMKDGNISEYTRKLEAENPGITDILLEEMRLIHKPAREELRAIISEYSKRVKIMKEGIKELDGLDTPIE